MQKVTSGKDKSIFRPPLRQSELIFVHEIELIYFLIGIRVFRRFQRVHNAKTQSLARCRALERTYYRNDSKRPAILDPKQILDVTSPLLLGI